MDLLVKASLEKKIKSVATGIESINIDEDNGNVINFNLANGTTIPVEVPVLVDGIFVTDISFNAENHLICTLSDNTTIDVGEIPSAYDDTEVKESIEAKVDKVEGKGLSTNDYTDEEKEKLSGLKNYDDTGVKESIETNASDIGELNRTIEDLHDDIWITTTEVTTLHYHDLEWENGYIQDDGIKNHSAYKTSEKLIVTSGDLVDYVGLRGLGGSSNIIIASYDSNDNYIETSSVISDGSVQSGSFIVPDGVSYVRVITYAYADVNCFDHITMPYTSSKFCTDDDTKRISNIEIEQQVQNTRLDELEQSNRTFDYEIINFFEIGLDTVGGINLSGGNWTYTSLNRSDYISTDNIIEIEANIKGVNRYSTMVACYDSNKNFIENKSLKCDSDEYETGKWIFTNGTITIDDTIKFVRVSHSFKEIGYNDTITIKKKRSLVDDYEYTKNDVSTIKNDMDSIWKGKKWYAFGTSLTDNTYLDPNKDPTGKYPQLLNEYMKADLINCGKGGGSITSYNNLILNKIDATDFSDADLITLEGFPNDYAMPIGDFLDTTTDTLAGAIYTAVTKFYEKAPHATVVLITASQGQLNSEGTAGYPIDFSNGKQINFNEMIIKMGRYLGCHVIDAGGKSQINNFHSEYLVDHIHHSWRGGQQFADTIWEELKNIHPNTKNKYF